MSNKIEIKGFQAKKVSLADLTPEQQQFVVNEANETGKPIEQIILELEWNITQCLKDTE